LLERMPGVNGEPLATVHKYTNGGGHTT
jgi:hypothetical protein